MGQTIYELSPDHSAVIITVQNKPNFNNSQPGLTNKFTNRPTIKNEVNNSVLLDVRLKSKSDIDEVLQRFNKILLERRLYSISKYFEENRIERSLFVNNFKAFWR